MASLNLLRSSLLLIADLVLFGLFTVLAFGPCLILWSYRLLVCLIARLLHPDWTLLGSPDTLFTFHRLGKERQSKVRQNIGWSLRIQSPRIPLKEIQDKFIASFLTRDREAYAGFYSTFTRFGGYTFRKPIPLPNINHLIRSYDLKAGQTLEEFTIEWLTEPYQLGAPMWGVLLIPLPASDQTVLLFKICHSLADGYNLVHFLDTLTGNESPYLVKEFQGSVWTNIREILAFPRTLPYYVRKAITTMRNHPFNELTRNGADSYAVSMFALDLGRLKDVRRSTKAHMMSVFLSLMGGIVSKICAQPKGSVKVPDYMQTIITLPWPNHPIKRMCNHWSTAVIRVPLGAASSSFNRLMGTEEDFLTFHSKGFHKTSNWILVKFYNLLPTRLYQSYVEWNPGIQTAFTALIGSTKAYELSGHPVVSIHPLIGTISSRVGLIGFAFTYADQVSCTLVATSEVAGLAGGPSGLSEYFIHEFQDLEKLVIV